MTKKEDEDEEENQFRWNNEIHCTIRLNHNETFEHCCFIFHANQKKKKPNA